MADNMVASLFGLTPEMYGEQQRRSALNEGITLAQLSPSARGTAMIYGGAKGLGNAIGGLMGVEDPMLNRITQQDQLLRGLDFTNPESLLEGAKIANQMGNRQAAFALTDYARKQASEIAQAQQRLAAGQASLAAASRERFQADPEKVRLAKAVAATRGPEGSPEYITAYNESLEKQMTPTEKPARINYGDQANIASQAKFGLPFDQLSQEQAKVIDTLLQERGVTKAKASAGKPVDVASIIQEVGSKETTKAKAEAWKAAGEAYKTQVPMIEKLKEVKANLPATFTGAFSETALQFGKALSAFGVPVDENKLSNTEYMNSVSSQVLQTIARNFPGSLAVKEMDQLVKSKFSSPQQIKTIARILNDLQIEIEAGTKSYEQLAKLPESERYSKDVNLLTGQNFTKLKRYRALEDKARSLKPGEAMTQKEVEDAKKLQQELGV